MFHVSECRYSVMGFTCYSAKDLMLQCEGCDVTALSILCMVMVAAPQIQLPQRRTLPNVCWNAPLEATITRQVKPDKMGERRERPRLGDAAAEAIVRRRTETT